MVCPSAIVYFCASLRSAVCSRSLLVNISVVSSAPPLTMFREAVAAASSATSSETVTVPALSNVYPETSGVASAVYPETSGVVVSVPKAPAITVNPVAVEIKNAAVPVAAILR